MLNIKKINLNYYPRLIHLGDAEFKSRVQKKQLLPPVPVKVSIKPLFKLDWEPVDKLKIEQYLKWRDQYWSEAKEFWPKKVPETLPKEYEWVSDLTYAIPKSYQDEIEHFTALSIVEWSRKRSFDTVIREMCLDVREKAINCAFKLIADCIYDEEKKGWARSNKFLTKHLLMYKFWREVTGRGLVYDHAEFERIEWLANTDSDLVSRKESEEARKCIDRIKEWEEEQEELCSFKRLRIKGDVKRGE